MRLIRGAAINNPMRPLRSLSAVATGVVLIGIATAAQARAVPAYHWCPGQPWDSTWGLNWDSSQCHNEHHRDADGDDHSRDVGDARGPEGFEPPGFDPHRFDQLEFGHR